MQPPRYRLNGLKTVLVRAYDDTRRLRLDADSLTSRGWTDLPKDWVPPAG